MTDIFFVEDDEDFSIIMETAVKLLGRGLSIKRLDNGRDSLEYLLKIKAEILKPRLLLLDLNLPGLSGLDLLKQIKETPFLNEVPVLLFSTSENPRDIKASKDLGADGYFYQTN